MKEKLIIKVCGMRDSDNIREVEAIVNQKENLSVDWIGFIFSPRSPRYVKTKPAYMPSGTKRVGVFVNDTEESIIKHVDEFKLDFVQLHGAESPEFCTRLKKHGFHLIKAFPIVGPEDLIKTSDYEVMCDYFLFDTKCSTDGGSGRLFDWSVLSSYKGSTPFLLSGGLGEDVIAQLREFSHPQWCGIDLNSRFEKVPAIKDIDKIKYFLQSI